MSDLEEIGFIMHPHTSAGRVPTDKGYRYYVDTLMPSETLSIEEKEILHSTIESTQFSDFDEIFKEASRILGNISHQIAIVSAPEVNNSILQKLDLIPISSTRIMVVLSIVSGFVKTMMFEVESIINPDYLDRLASLLNERLAGLTLGQIRETFVDRFRDAANEKSGLIRLFIVASDKLFSAKLNNDKIHVDGIHDAVQQPEFNKPENLQSIIELLEDKRVIIHVLDNRDRQNSITITIGGENKEEKLQEFSIITSKYLFGQVEGTVGIIGPKRMNYSKLTTIVDYISKLISDKYSS